MSDIDKAALERVKAAIDDLCSCGATGHTGFAEAVLDALLADAPTVTSLGLNNLDSGPVEMVVAFDSPEDVAKAEPFKAHDRYKLVRVEGADNA